MLLAAFGPGWVAAQTATQGGISGRVSDESTGRSLQGAIVRVLGTPAADASDVNGRYSLPAVPAGTFTLEVEYVGLNRFTTEVTVRANETITVNAGLVAADVLKLETFTVNEQLRGQALAVNQQKTAAGIVNIVSEETFGNMIGGNIGYALQRLPGLTVNESEDGTPSGVNIRGLESQYNSFQIDGNRLPTSGTGRGFGTGQLSADGIANIEVIKAPTPDRDGDAIGGIINVVTRSAFQRSGRSVQATGSGVFYDKNESWGYNGSLVYSDLLNAFGGQRNLGLSLTATTYETSRDYDNLDKDYALVTPAALPALGLTEPLYFHSNGTPQTNYRDTSSQGLNLDLDFRISDRMSVYVKPFWSTGDVTAEKPRNRYYIATSIANIESVTYNTGAGRPTALTEIRYQNEKTESDNDLHGVSFGAKHELDTIAFNYDAFLSTNEAGSSGAAYTVRNQGFSIGYDQSNRSSPVYTIRNGRDPRDVTTINRGDLNLTAREGQEDVLSLKADWEKKFVGDKVSAALKVGAKHRVSKKEQDSTNNLYRTGTNAAGFPYASIMRRTDIAPLDVPIYLVPDMDALMTLFAAEPARFVFQTGDSALNAVISDFEAEEDTTAAYAMGTFTFGPHQLIGGLRLEHNVFESDTFVFNASQPLQPGRAHASRSYSVWLPGLHLRHELRKNLILRESYNRSYSRPDMEALVAGLQVDPATGNMSGGNPNLKETTSDNLDLQLEYYTDRAGLYSAGFFYKKMKGFYYDRTYNFSQLDATGYPIPDAAGPLQFSTTDNALGATNYGLELIARQNLYFLPGPLNGFNVSLSATFTKSDGKYPGRLEEKLPTYGFSDTIYYAALEYVRGKFRGQLSYRYRSDYLEGLDVDNTFDDYFGANDSLDWESSYQLTKSLKLFLNLNNLTDEPQISYQGYRRTDNPEDYTTYSWRGTLGLTASF